MAAPYGDGVFAMEPPQGYGLNITDLFHIVEPKATDPGINSRVDSQYPNVAIITFDDTNQFGGMWAKEQLDLTMPFSTEMYLHLGHQYGKSGTVADGMTFTMHNDPAELNAIGGAGEGLGVYKGRKWTGEYYQGNPVTAPHGTYLRNSLVIEFDTYRNQTSQSAFVDDPVGSEPAHCSLLIPRADTILIGDHKNTHFFTPKQDWVKFEANWEPNSSGGGTLTYTFNGQQKTYTVNNIIATFDSTKVYWGFTGATGQLTSVQAAAITRLPKQGIIAEKTVSNAIGEDINHGRALPGDILSYTIRVTAQSLSEPIGPITIADEISEYVEYGGGNVIVRTKAGDVFEVPSSYSGNIMTVYTTQYLTEEGDYLEITFGVRVKEGTEGNIVYNAAVVSAENLSEPQDTNITEVKIIAKEDPEKKVSENSEAGQGGSPVKLGDKITYGISYLNYEETGEATIVITDILPAGVDFESATDDGTYDDATHTATWNLPGVPSGTAGTVSVVVRVNEKAVVKIVNSAMVKVGDNEPRTTNNVENPVTPENPEKKVSESSEAGQGGSPVKLGDKITYDISYLNYEGTEAAIVITDELAAGVNFESATNDGKYDDATHTVTWNLSGVPSGTAGTVSVVVSVNERAMFRIENYATVQVGSNAPMITNNVENPVTPVSPEKKVSESSAAGQGGSAVKVGDRITYSISYLNYEEADATIVITDRLPNEVDFESAANGGIYDDATHTVTWTLPDVPSGIRGMVSVVVRVNERALEKIENIAAVKVGDNEPQTTNTVTNPVTPEEPVKKVSNSSEAGKDGGAVKAGDKITYDIIYNNYTEIDTTVVITDRLPVGVDFESATNGGKYDNATHTVVWTLPNIPGGTFGTVSVVVRVNEKAVVRIMNYAVVKVGSNNPQVTNSVTNPIKGAHCSDIKQEMNCRKKMKGRKIWEDNDNRGNTRPPSVEIILIRDGVIYQSISIDSMSEGDYTFGCLPIWKNTQQEYHYQIDEAMLPDDYTKTIEGYDVINTLSSYGIR